MKLGDLFARIWKPSADECRRLREAGVKAAQGRRAISLEPGLRCPWGPNPSRPDADPAMNIALVSDDPKFADTDLHDYGRWSDFRRGVPLTPDGRAILDFYVRPTGFGADRGDSLLGHVTVWWRQGVGIERMQVI
jgi:hypothetical protein